MKRPARAARAPSWRWTAIAAIVVVGGLMLFFRAVIGLVAGLFKVIVVTVLFVAVVTWFQNRSRSR